MKKKRSRLIIPNDIFEGEKKLTVEETYLLSWLYTKRVPDDWVVELNIDVINAICCKFSNGDDYRNKRTIKLMLNELKNKKYINEISDCVINNEMKNSDVFSIKFPYVKESVGYNAKITYDIFYMFVEPLDFYIYAYIDQFGDEGRAISYNKWSKLVKRSERTVQDTIDKMNTDQFKPRIWKFSGDYYKDVKGKVWQHENKYYTRPSDAIKKKWNSFYSRSSKNLLKENCSPF